MTDLPLHHYHHLKRLAELRRCNLRDAFQFAAKTVSPKSDDWITRRNGEATETRDITTTGYSRDEALRVIQGIPRNIRPVTDGPYLEAPTFISGEAGLLGVAAEGVRILDFEMVTDRERAVFPLIRDLLPAMSIEQFRVYATFNSQFLRLLREPQLFTMPRLKEPAVDAGCYVGYKAMALASFVGGNPVLAFELAGDTFEVLRKNAKANPSLNIRPIRAALSDRRDNMTMFTRDERTMAHSLTSFSELREANEGLLTRDQAEETIETTLLDDYTAEFDRLSAVHISVNGHETEVVRGGLETARKADILRVSAPYDHKGTPVHRLVTEALGGGGVQVFGRSGAAIVAGQSLGNYHVQA